MGSFKNRLFKWWKEKNRDKIYRDLELRLNRFLEYFKTKSVPRDSEILFKRFYD